MSGRELVVLGSATPSMESFYNTARGKYQLLELPTRADLWRPYVYMGTGEDIMPELEEE